MARGWLVICVLAAGTAHAEPRHTVFGELLGKGGLWGAGYEYAVTPRLSLGAVGSVYVLHGDRFMTLSPYVSLYPIGLHRHRWFIQAGPQLVRRSTPSPVPEWQGMATTAWDGELSSGYEYRNQIVVRAYAMAELGTRLAPWVGTSIGWTW
jgi:hypothetical protein